MPGHTNKMRPKPDHGEESYRGSGKLAGKLLNVRFGSLCGLRSDISRGPEGATFGSRCLSRERFQQRLRVLQIARLEPLSEPPVNRSQQFARFPHLALIAPEACKTYRRRQLKAFRGFLYTSLSYR